MSPGFVFSFCFFLLAVIQDIYLPGYLPRQPTSNLKIICRSVLLDVAATFTQLTKPTEHRQVKFTTSELDVGRCALKVARFHPK